MFWRNTMAVDMQSRMMGVEDAAKLLAISPWTLRRWAYQSKIESHKLGTRLCFSDSAIEAFIQRTRRPVAVAAPAEVTQ
jgi:excisionase family DNA binding protein